MATTTVPWWKRTTVYQIYPRSFADSNGDGIGDLRGVIERLDYLRELGVETLWLSPFYDSPQADFGYDIRDYFNVAPEYGTLDDARELIEQVHARGMKIVFDMVLNHTSNQHPWFTESRSSRHNPKRDWYIWRPGRGRLGTKRPNNWLSIVGGSGWHWDDTSQEFYWASFLPFQPDLNYRNPEVKETMLNVVRHWLRQGVDGLRLDVFNALYKDESFSNNPFSLRPIPTESNPHGFFQRYVHTIDHPDTLRFAQELRRVTDEFDNPPRFMVGEVFGDPVTLRRYCGDEADGLHLVFLFKTLRMRFAAKDVSALIREIEHAFPEPYTPTYVFGNHDRPRLAHKLDNHHHKAKLFAALQLTLRGVPFVYYGEEIGMGHHEIPLVHGLDPIAVRHRWVPQWLARFLLRFGILLNRDECRAPMQWHAGPHAGFTAGHSRPWLALHPAAKDINVDAQVADPESLWSCYRGLLTLRKQSLALSQGSLTLLSEGTCPVRLPKHVVGYRRNFVQNGAPQEEATILLNFGRKPAAFEMRQLSETVKPARVFSTHDARTSLVRENLVLKPYEGLVILH